MRWKVILYNTSFALNCLLVFLLIFEGGLSVPPWVQTIGRMHPLLLHFPIVLLVLSVFWELVSLKRKPVTPEQSAISDLLVLLASFTAVTSALMGLFLSKEDGYTQEVVAWHKWGGIFISLLSLAWYAFRDHIRRRKVVMALTSLTAMVIVIITGHLGADITHGENFLFAPVTKDLEATNVLFEDAEVYAHMVQPILKSKCYSCHNVKKAKGELVMEPVSLLLKGGKSGALWDSTEKDFGLLLRRLHLPLENKKHMPPAGKPQLTDEETTIIHQWIHSGTSFTAKVADLPETDSLRILAAALFNTIETDTYAFEPADESKVGALRNNYRLVNPLSLGSPALGVDFFGASQFKAEQLKELLAVKEQVVSLNLNKMPVTDDGLKTIAQFVNLRRLNLSFTNIKGSGLAALNQLKELRQLSLSGTGVTASDLTALAALPKLTHLYIWSTPAQSHKLAIQRQLKNIQIETGFTGDTIVIKLNPPLVENEQDVLYEPTPLQLKHYVKGVAIHYTTDGTEPDSVRSPVYKSNVTLSKNTTVKAKAFKPGWVSSDIAAKSFYKAGYNIDSIRLLQPAPDAPYTTFKATILTDREKGDQNFRSGKWMGYRGRPLQAVFYFDTVQSISSVTISTLVNIGSFIMPPQQVEVWAGNDPSHLRLVKKMSPEQPLKDVQNFLKGYEVSFDPIRAKHLKVVVTPVGKLPAWHPGKGDRGWVFVDEFFLN